MKNLKTILTPRRVRRLSLGGALVLVILFQAVPGWGEAYSTHLYPVVAWVLSGLSALLPFAVGDLFIALSIAGVLLYPFYARYRRKKKWRQGLAGSVEYLVWVYVWFYAAWGLNYSQPDFYQRTGIEQARYTETDFRAFTRSYIDRLNTAYTPLLPVSPDTLRAEAVEGYRQMAPTIGIHAPFHPHPQVKTMLFSPLASMVGVKGSMGPFFCEFTVNADVPPSEYPATYTHELAHLLGIANEGEANFYAYLVCTRSSQPAIRFSGYFLLLPYVLNNAYRLLDEEEYTALCHDIRPEILQLARENQTYWLGKYNRLVGEAQSRLYELYLKGNRIAEGQKSYSQVVGLLIAYEKHQTQKARSQSVHSSRTYSVPRASVSGKAGI